MTVTTLETGLRAQLLRFASGAVAFAIALGIGVAGATSATAATDETAEAESVELFVTAGVYGSVAPGSAMSASVTVQNETETALSPGRVSIELGRTPLADAASVSAWLDNGEGGAAFASLGAEATEAVEAGGTVTTSVFVPQATLGELAPGVYPLRAELNGTTADGLDSDSSVAAEVSATSVLIIAAGPAPEVGVLVPITATPESGALLSAVELVALTAPDGALTAQLDAVAGTAATLAIDPAIPAAIRALGTSAPTRVTEWLTRLEDLPNERFALQFGDADAAAQAHAGIPALLEPTTLSPFVDPKSFPSAQTPSPTPAPTEAAAPDLPDDAELMAVPGARSRILWPGGDVTAADLATFSGYVGGPALTIVPSSSVSEKMSGHAASGEHELLVTDTAVSAALSAAAAEPDAPARERWLAAAGAQLALAAQNAPAAPLLVGLDRDETRTAEALRAAISAVDSPTFDLAALRSTPPASVTLTVEPDTARAEALRTLLDEEVALNDFSSVLTDPQVLLSPERIKLLRVMSVGRTAEEFADAVAVHREGTQATLDSVGIERSSTIRLYGANADLGFWVRNDLPWPVNVRLYANPSDPRLDVQRMTDAVADAAGNTRIKVPVSARVGSGDLTVELSLSSPSGVAIGSTQYASVSVRAEWETIGLIVFGGLATLLIVLGVVRTVRRKRRDAEEAARAAEAARAEEAARADEAADAADAEAVPLEEDQ